MLIDWAEIERTFAVSFTSGRGRPALSLRLIAGLLYLQHALDASGETVVDIWVENPYWQFFCGEAHLQTELPIDPFSLTRWRQRVSEEGVDALLAASIYVARRGGVIQKASMQQIIVDTTVMPKAIAHPTDSRLLDKSRQHLVVGMRFMPSNSYDGHTLAKTLKQVSILTGTDRPPVTAIVDKGYQGVQIERARILRLGQKQSITKTLKAMIKRRSATEPIIVYMKMDGRLTHNSLKGALGDALHAVMCGAGHNLRLILAALRLYCAQIRLSMQAVIAALVAPALNTRSACS